MRDDRVALHAFDELARAYAGSVRSISFRRQLKKAKSGYNLDLYSSVQRAHFFFVILPLLFAFSAVSMAFPHE